MSTWQLEIQVASMGRRCFWAKSGRGHVRDGSVPVYVGDATSLKKLAPPHSVIYAADFAGPEVLAAHLYDLATNQSAYDAYLAWRQDADQSLRALRQVMALPAWEVAQEGSRACALCEFLWAAPHRTHPNVSSDLCQSVEGTDEAGRGGA